MGNFSTKSICYINDTRTAFIMAKIWQLEVNHGHKLRSIWLWHPE